MSRLTAFIVLGVLLTGAALGYASRLGYAPAYLMQDEVNFALQAQSIATSGRDTNGRLLPVYFSEVGFEAGRDPVMIYLTALMLKIRPLSESAVRMPTALTGVLSIGLMFLVARRLFRSDALGLVAAGLLALTPGHFVNSRLALSITYPIPFILAWLWCLCRYLEQGDRRLLLSAGIALGAGVYSYVASLIMMPVYLALTIAIVARERRTFAWSAVLGFAIAMLPLAWWQLAHPDRYGDLVAVYRGQEVLGVETIRGRLTAVWMFFNPDYLFLSGDSRLTNSTRSAGLFPLACAVFIPTGLYQLWRGAGGALGGGILAAFLASPLAAAVSGRLEINRVLYAIPFGVLVAMRGVTTLLSSRHQAIRLAAAALLASVVLQFGFVYLDYIGAYRVRSAPWFGGDARGAIEDVLARPPASSIYLDGRTPIERYWRFYVLVHGQPGLIDRPTYYDPQQFDPLVAANGSLLICAPASPVCKALGSQAAWRRISSRIEPDATTSFEVFEKLHADK